MSRKNERASVNNDLEAQVLPALKEGLEKAYGDRLKSLLLFGSRARNEGEPESDLDVAVILDDFADSFAEVERVHELVHGLSLEYGCVIGVVPVREREYRSARFPLHINLRHEGVPV